MSCGSKAGAILGSCVGIPLHVVLTCVGAGGAPWGVSDAMGWRTEENKSDWQIVTYCFLGAGLLALGATYAREPAKKGRHSGTFCSSLWHAVAAPHQALKDEFADSEAQPLISTV